MAKEEQVSLLKQGVGAWNKWREKNSDAEIDLSGADLINTYLSNADLSSANLSHVKLTGVYLSNANLSNANLSGADLINTYLGDADLSNANLSASYLINAYLGDADLSNAELSNTKLRGASISHETLLDPKWKLVHELVNEGGEGKDLSNSDLSSAYLHEVDLSNANLSHANLSNTDLSHANLSNADLSHAILRGINLNKANLGNADLSNSNLSHANLRSADLSNAELSHAILRGASISYKTLLDPKWKLVHELVNEGGEGKDLSNSDLSNAYLHEVDLSNADLSGANLCNTDFSNADLYKVNLHKANLAHANLKCSSLNSANLCEASLQNASLYKMQALDTNFCRSNLIGACIADWHISSGTLFGKVKGDYIYRGYDKEQDIFTDRLPVNSGRVFQSGEFEEWIRISAEAQQTIDLTFTDGIDWQAFFQSLQDVRQKYPDENVGLQAIEDKGTAFVIRLKTSSDADQGAIEATQKAIYQEKLKVIEGEYKTKLAAKDTEIELHRGKSADMTEIVKLLAQRPINVEAKAVAESKPANQTTVNAQTIGALHTGSGDIKEFSQNIGNQGDEITQLINSLRNLAQSFPEEQQEIVGGELEDLEHDVKTPDNHQPNRIGRKLKRLRQAGTAVLALAGTTVVSGVAFTDNANKFVENIDKLGDKLGIEIIQDKQKENK